MSMKKKSILLVLMFLAPPAHGMVYSWSDSAGITHYVNKEYDIPTRFRAKAKALYPEQSENLAPQQSAQIPQTKLEEPGKDSPPVVTSEPRKIEPASVVRRSKRSRASRSTED